MKINRVRLKGWIGIKKGLGLDEVNIDLSSANGLVAISGPNGLGKTTFIESLSPYRTLASRNKSLRYHVYSRQSERELFFEYGGDEYRTLIKIDSDSDRSEGFIWKNGGSQVDGKVTNYDRYIEGLLGTSNLFYNSVFCAQNSDKMSDMTTGQLKQLFVEFLRLDRLAKYEAAAKQCVTVLGGTSQQLHRNISGLQQRLDEFMDLDLEIGSAARNKDELSDRLAVVLNTIQKNNELMRSLADIQTKNSVNIERRDELEKDIKDIRDERTQRYDASIDEAGKIKKAIGDKRIDLESCHAILKRKDGILQASERAKNIEAEIIETRKEYDKRGTILESLYQDERSASQELQSLLNNLQGFENNSAIARLTQGINDADIGMESAAAKIRSLKQKLEDVKKSVEIARIDSEIKACIETKSLLDQRGECPTENPQCSFVLSAVKAKEKLPVLEQQKRDILLDIQKKSDAIIWDIEQEKQTYSTAFLKLKSYAFEEHALRAEIAKDKSEVNEKISAAKVKQLRISSDIKEIKRTRDELIQSMVGLESDLKTQKELSNKLNEIQKAETRVEQLNSEIKTLEDSIQDKRDQYTLDELQSKTRIKDLEKRLENVKSLIDEEAPKKITETRALITAQELDRDNLNRKIKTEDERIAVLNRQLEEKAGIEKQIVIVQEDLGRTTAESAQWLYLQNSCGKSGLQALEIDGVAPLITGYANDLLTSSFGPNFSVRLITQDPETGKEILDIVVIRGDGSETRLDNLSGGEKVWVLKSLRLAMTLVSKEKSGRNFQTILCDEEDGPLDSEKAQSFIGLYKSILSVGGFDSCFYISHNPEVVGMADHQISFSREGIRVV